MAAYGDFTHPFRKIAGELAPTISPLPISKATSQRTLRLPSDAHTFSFVSDPAMIDGFKLAGIDAVSLANNHSPLEQRRLGRKRIP